MSIEVKQLDFDEEIVLDHSSMPEDSTEGAQARDIMLSELLHADSFDLDEDLEVADILQDQGF
ncbi:MAG: hypothetical protein R3254_01020 [Thiomicrorhabdus sp.]|nr:hypothetical protein [Thiomicrorhabdus sp.]